MARSLRRRVNAGQGEIQEGQSPPPTGSPSATDTPTSADSMQASAACAETSLAVVSKSRQEDGQEQVETQTGVGGIPPRVENNE